MRHFRSIEEIRAAEVEELLAVDGMNRPAAKEFISFSVRKNHQNKISNCLRIMDMI